MIDQVTPDAIDTVSQLGPLGVWSLVLWQLARAVGALQDYVRVHGEHLVEEAKHWSDEASHRRAEVDRWRESADRAARQERLLQELVERGARRRTRPVDPLG